MADPDKYSLLSLVQWSDQQPRLTSAPPMTPPVKPPMRNTEVEVTRTPGVSDTGASHAPGTPVVRNTVRCQPPVTPVQARASVTSLNTPDQASPSLHPDILAVLSWQNEQLSALQVSHHFYPRDPCNNNIIRTKLPDSWRLLRRADPERVWATALETPRPLSSMTRAPRPRGGETAGLVCSLCPPTPAPGGQ